MITNIKIQVKNIIMRELGFKYSDIIEENEWGETSICLDSFTYSLHMYIQNNIYVVDL